MKVKEKNQTENGPLILVVHGKGPRMENNDFFVFQGQKILIFGGLETETIIFGGPRIRIYSF